MPISPTAFASPVPLTHASALQASLAPLCYRRPRRSRTSPQTAPRMSLPATSEVAECEAILLAGLVGKEQGRGMADVDRSRIDLLCLKLEQLGSPVPISWPENLSTLDGPPWTLLYSTEPLPPTSVPLLPPFSVFVSGVEQRFDTPARTVQNVILLRAASPLARPGSRADAELVVTNSFSIAAVDVLALAIVSVEVRVRGLGEDKRMRNFLPPLAIGRLRDALERNGSVYYGGGGRSQSETVTTTFIGCTLRITRSPGGALRVFTRFVL